MQTSIIILIIVVNLLFILAVVIAIIFYLKRKIKKTSSSQIPTSVNNGEIDIKIIASFGGFKFLPSIISISHNNANPKLVLTESGIRYRVFITQSKPYSKIEKVDIMSSIGTELIIFSFTDTVFTFSGNLYTKEHIYNALKLLDDKKVPMSKKSEVFLRDYKPTKT